MKSLISTLVILLPLFSLAADPFWWGAGHAAFQVEGSPQPSDWNQWAHQPNGIADGTNADTVSSFWITPEKDFALARDLGAKMFRISIAWERIQTGPDQWEEKALDRYEQIIVSMRKYGLEPMVTLHHFVLPLWLAETGGLTSIDFSDHFTKYALKVVKRLSNGPAKVRWWMTFNEPLVLINEGYLLGHWPPHEKGSFWNAFLAEKNIANAHLKAVSAIREDTEIPKDLKLSVAYHWRLIQAEGFGIFNSLVADIGDWIFNRQFMNSISSSIDYLGINYYGRNVFHWQWKMPFIRVDEGEGEKSDLNWVIYPEGLGQVLRSVSDLYHLPIIISENGLADAADSRRVEFLRSHLDQVRKAKREGIPVIGYLHWSLTDNFEWAHGLSPRFGLVEMDYKTGERKPRPSYHFYKELIQKDFWVIE